MNLVGFFILGIAAGILSGLFGIGGGIVLVPSLIVIFGLDILDANAISLAAMLLPVGILGVWAYYKEGYVNIVESLWVALGLFLGSFVGGEIAVNISESLLAKLYAGILIYISISYFDLPKYFRKKATIEEVEKPHEKKSFWAFILVGVAAGIFAGLFLIKFFRYDSRSAAATSLAALQLPVGLPSVIIYAKNGHLNLLFAGLIAAGIFAGAFFGSKLGIKIPPSIFKKIYAVFLLVVAVYMVFEYI